MSVEKVRDPYWDSLKFILIVFVVLGHTLELYVPDGSFNRAVYNTIYLFHMPLFVFISGRFSHVRNIQLFNQSILRQLETLVVFQIIRSFFMPMMTGEEIQWKYIIVPNWILWYLMSLIWWRLLIKIAPPKVLVQHKTRIIIASFVISLLGGFVPLGHPLEVQRTLVFLPFFMLGYYSTDTNVINTIKKKPVLVAVASFMLFFYVFYHYINYSLAWLLSAGQHYWEIEPPMLVRFLARLLFLPCSFLACIMAMRLSTPNRLFSKWGKSTMILFIYHPFLLDLLKWFIRTDFLPNNSVVVYLYAFIILLILLGLSNQKMFKIMLNPISFLNSKFKYV